MKLKLVLFKDGQRYIFTKKKKNDESVNVLMDMIFESKYEACIEVINKKKGLQNV